MTGDRKDSKTDRTVESERSQRPGLVALDPSRAA